MIDLLLIAELLAAAPALPSAGAAEPPAAAVSSITAPAAAATPSSLDPAAAAPAPTETVGAPPAVFHEELLVVAARRPLAEASTAAAVSVLDGRELALLPAVSAAQAVSLLPGFQVLSASPFGGVPMELARGFFGGGEAGYVQLRVDGVPLADAETGAADWAAVAASEIARVEALRGAASPLYGDTALGGVVELTTRPASEGPGAGGGLAAGSFGTLAADLRLAAGDEPLAASLTVDLRRSDGARDHDASERLGARLRLDGATAGGRDAWSFALSGGRHRREEPGPLSFAELAADREASQPLFRFDRDDEDRLTASLSWQRAAPWSLRARGWHDRRDVDGVRTLLLAAGFGDRAARRLAANATGLAASAAGDFALPGAGDWLLGVDLAREELDSRHRPVDEEGRHGAVVAAVDGERWRQAAFANLGWEPLDRLRLVGGVRWDRIDDRFAGAGEREAWSPRLGAVVRLRRDRPWVAFVHASRAFKTPTLDQLFDRRPLPDGAGGSFTLANPELVPQRARSVEAGLRGFGPGASWRLAAYRTAVEDEIDFDPATFRFVNIGASLHRGVEVAGDLVSGRRGRLEVGWEWSEVSAREGATAGRQLKNVPEHVGRLLGILRLPGGVAGGLAVRHLAGRHLDDEHRFGLPDATVVDLRLSRPFGAWELRLDVFNLLDDDLLWVGFALPSFDGGVVPFAFPGHPRAAMLGLRWTGGG